MLFFTRDSPLFRLANAVDARYLQAAGNDLGDSIGGTA